MPGLSGAEPAPNRKVLIVAYQFPPVGGAGVQRVAKLVKYLGEYGWQPTVLTVTNPSVPVRDASLENEIPATVEIARARTWEPGYAVKTLIADAAGKRRSFLAAAKSRVAGVLRGIASGVLQPDPQILWYPDAVRVGRTLLRQQGFAAILATAPPFSAFLLASRLARMAKVPLVADYRDEWTISNQCWENRKNGRLSAICQKHMENYVLRTAAAVITTTRASTESLRARCQEAGSEAAVHTIYNGYDDEDFTSGSQSARSDSQHFRLIYTGTLWNLTTVAPLVEAVKSLASKRPDLANRLELQFVGRRIGAQIELVESLRNTPCKLVVHDYLDHGRSLELLREADASCLLLSDLPGAERVVPAKTFEYMAVGHPILAILPRGETWDLLDGYPQAGRFHPEQVVEIKNWLMGALQKQHNAKQDVVTAEYVKRFSRYNQAGEFAAVLNRCEGASKR